MKARVVWAIARKDILEIFANRTVMGPVLLTPLMLVIGLPLYGHMLGGERDPDAFNDLPPTLIHDWLGHLPPALAASVHGLPPGPLMAVLLTGHLAAPAFILAPVAVASLAGAIAFVGEKERRTLEGLLYAPVTDAELIAGKLIAVLVPALLLGWLTFAAYVLTENAATWSFMARWWFPTAVWWPWIFWFLPACVLLATACTVAISTRVRTQVGANQLTSISTILVTTVTMVQAVSLLSSAPWAAWIGGSILWLVDAGVLAWVVRDFSRERLMRRM